MVENVLKWQPMAQRRFHYDQAFERYLRGRGIPYVAVDEARRAISGGGGGGGPDPAKLKNFDFVVYSRSGSNLLVDVKGRRHFRPNHCLENWVTDHDIESLSCWESLFGQGFTAAFVFLYWCDALPPGVLFHDTFESNDRWYSVLAVTLADYRTHIRPRSASWGTVSVPAQTFQTLARPMYELL